MSGVERPPGYAYANVSTALSVSDTLEHAHPLYVAKPCPFNLQTAVTPQSCLPNLIADMLPFQVTVGPDVQLLAIPRLGLNVLGNGLLVLQAI